MGTGILAREWKYFTIRIELAYGRCIDLSPRPGRAVAKGGKFTYVFDFGDNWQHHCLVTATNVAPLTAAGVVPDQPIPIWGWGCIPDQYGRRSEDDNGEDDEGAPGC